MLQHLQTKPTVNILLTCYCETYDWVCLKMILKQQAGVNITFIPKVRSGNIQYQDQDISLQYYVHGHWPWLTGMGHLNYP